MTNKNDDVAGKMPRETPEMPDLGMPSLKEVMESVGSAMGGSIRGMQELAAWQMFASSAVAGLCDRLDVQSSPDDIAERAVLIADHLLVIWKERRDAVEKPKDTKK